MTADELADYLDNNVEAMLFTEQKYLDEASKRIREQGKYIAQLECRITELEFQIRMNEMKYLERIEELEKELSNYTYSTGGMVEASRGEE